MKKSVLLFSIIVVAAGICVAQKSGLAYRGQLDDRSSLENGVPRFERRPVNADEVRNQNGRRLTAMATVPHDFRGLLDFLRNGEQLAFDGGFRAMQQELSATSLRPAIAPASSTAIWIGGTGNWEVASNWSPAVVPNNGTPAGTTYAVIIDNGAATNSQVHLNSNVTVDSLTINGGGRLDINDGQSLTIVNSGPGTGTIVNDGILALNASANPTALVINGNVTLSGGGLVQLSNSGKNQIYGLTATDVLTNQGSAISGAGNIGVNSMTLNNQGVITCNGSLSLLIDPGNGGVSNSGTIQASSGSVLGLQDGVFDNAGGTIQASGNGAINVNATASITGGTVNVNALGGLSLDGGSITGGTLNNSGSISTSTTGTLGGTVNNLASGNITLFSGSVLKLTGGAGNSYSNAGTISINDSGSSSTGTNLVIDGNVTLGGGGNVLLSPSAKNRIYGATATDVLTNQDNMISGGGNIGNNSMTLNNQGTIRGGITQNLIIDPGSGGVINSGTIESATGGSTSLFLQDGVFSNNGGTIRSNGTIEMSATTSITGGTMILPTTTALLLLNGGSITGGTLNNFGRIFNTSGTTGTLGGAVTNMVNGQIILSEGSVLVLTGGAGNTYSNAGVISINNTIGNTNTDLVINGNVTLSGAGSVQLANSVKSRIYGATATDVFTNQGNTISGSGNIGNNSMTLNNQGVITGNSFSLTIDPGNGGVSNSGTIQAVGIGTLHLQDGVFTNTGTIQTDSDGKIEMNATASITGGTVNVKHFGVLTLNGGSVTGGTLTNSGTILNPTGTTGTLGGTVNNTSGSISLLGGSVLLVKTAAFTNASFVTMDTGSTLTMGAGNNYTQTSGQTTVNGILNATGQVNIAGGILNGTGTVNADVNNGGRVDPGQSPGVLNITGNYTQTAGGTLGIELNGIAAGSGYDQVHLVGAAALTGTLSLTRGFPSAVGDKFKIIDNDGSDAVSGTFNDLPEAAVLTLNGQQFQISYSGGTGNDVELTTISAPPVATITWNDPADITYGTALGATQLNATASVPGTFAYNPAAGTLLNAGNNQTLSVNFTPTDPAYTSASKSVSINVLKANQTITFDPLANKTFGDPPFTVSATASSGLAVSFSIPSGPASISSNTVTITGAGTVSVRASQPGNGNYNAAVNVDQSFSVAKASQTITFSPLPNKTFGDPPFVVSATASSGLAVSLSILSGPASISGNTVTITGPGHVVVRAEQAGDSNYDPAPAVDQGFEVTSGGITVVNNNNSGAGSLRQAIIDAGQGATIGFAANVRGAIILDTPASPSLGGELLINKDLTINGPGANVLRLLQETGSEDRVLHIASGNVSISGLSISGGSDASSSQSGAGVLIDTGATLTLNACTVSRNVAFNTDGAGGVLNSGTLNVTNSTVESNTGDNAGIVNAAGTMTLTNTTIADNIGAVTGGVKVDGGTATILNCTIANNGSDEPDASAVGGLRIINGGIVNIKNTIIAKNVSGSGSVADVSGTVVSQGRNLIGNTAGSAGFGVNDLRNVNPQLGGLANNGGTTETFSLLAGSPAINQGSDIGAPPTDQRGVARPQGGVVDIGAYESGARPAPFGKIVFVSNSDGNNEIYSIDVNGAHLTRLTNNAANDTSPSWSRDGSRIVFTSDRDGNSEIYSMAFDGSNQARLTVNSVPDLDPDWSPDGTQIAFSRGGDIFVMDADGGNERRLTNFPFSIVKSHPSWSPDGAFITFQGQFGGGNYHILIIAAACSLCTEWNQMTAGAGNFISPAWSRDGNAIAYTIDDDEFGATTYISHQFDFFSSQLGIQSIASPNPKARFPKWSPDATEVVSVSDDAEGNKINLINSDGTNPTVLISNSITSRSSLPDWTGFQTGTGANVTAISGTVSISFSNVSANGTTTAVPIDPATAGTLSSGFSLGAGLPAYEITTTASVTPPITICINVPSVTDPAAFAQLKLLHNENGVLVDHTTLTNFNSKLVCGSVNSLSPFVIAQGSTPTAAPANISGQITDAGGMPLEGVVMTLTGTASPRRTITNADGHYAFTDVPTDGFYTVSPLRANYTFAPEQRSFGLLANRTDAVFTATANGAPSANPLDTAEYFVRQQYVDILGREPDEGGFNYWSDQILACGADAACANARRRDVAAAFFIETEFQRTGSYIYGLYEGALGRRPKFAEFSADRNQVVAGPTLEATKQAVAESFVQRNEFMTKYQGSSDPESFVDALIRSVLESSGVDLRSNRVELINTYNSVANLSNGTIAGRAAVIRRVSDNEAFKQSQYNRAFVLTEYFGYLRRDPDPEGFAFWLDVLNRRDIGNYRGMVCAFINSAEYQKRFSAMVAHSDQECGP